MYNLPKHYKRFLDSSEKVTINRNSNPWIFSLEEYKCAKALSKPFTNRTYSTISTSLCSPTVSGGKTNFRHTHVLRDFALYHLLFIAKEGVAIDRRGSESSKIPGKTLKLSYPIFIKPPNNDKIIRIDELLIMLGFSKTLSLLSIKSTKDG